MWLIDKVAEQRITEALQTGVFENLPGAGKPLRLDDDSHIPENLRVGYRLLKNAGYLPSELQIRKEISSLYRLLETLNQGGEGGVEILNAAQKRVNYLMTKLNINGCNAAIENAYYEKIQNSLLRHKTK